MSDSGKSGSGEVEMGSSCSGVMPLSRWLRRKSGGTDALLEQGDMRKDSEELRLADFFYTRMKGRGRGRWWRNSIKDLFCLPSNAAATLLLRFCVASNALAVAAAEGGLLVVMVYLTLLKGAEVDVLRQKVD